MRRRKSKVWVTIDHELPDQVGGAHPAQLADRAGDDEETQDAAQQHDERDCLERGEAKLIEQDADGDPASGAGEGRQRGDGLKSETRQRAHSGEPARGSPAESGEKPDHKIKPG